MPRTASTKIVILFEHEVVQAAQALSKLVGKGVKPTRDDYVTALRACSAAIYSPDLASGNFPVTVICMREHDKDAPEPK
jgi:hypothetical protein